MGLSHISSADGNASAVADVAPLRRRTQRHTHDNPDRRVKNTKVRQSCPACCRLFLGSYPFRLDCLGPLAPPRRALPANVCHPPQSLANQEADATCPFLPFPSRVITVTKLYVGNLPFTATDESVRTLFSNHGTVETVALITDRETGRARGFGFVEMPSADAARAMHALNGTDFDGRALKVNEAQDRERSGGGNRGPRRF